jgi:pimeloyl-ACP methyl ester carboxylesterase
VHAGELAANGLTFPYRTLGPSSGAAVLLLHGWPQTAGAWREVMPPLARGGLRVVAPTLRGYAPSARPTRVSAYGIEHLVADALAMIELAGGGEPVHVVGHDWGGAVAWVLAGRHPDRLASLTVLSTPHPEAMTRALLTSDQLFRSWYVAAFQVPGIPEWALARRGGAVLRQLLVRSGLPYEYARDYADAMSERSAMRAAINWYRAAARAPATVRAPTSISVPTSYIWSDGDIALNRTAAEATGAHVAAPYRFEVLEGVTHWIPETQPEAVARVVLDQAATSGSPLPR